MHWNCCVEDMCSHLQLLEFERSLPRKLRVQILNCWNAKEASHESLAFAFLTFGISMEFAQKLRFHTFNSWNLKETSRKCFVLASLTCGRKFSRKLCFHTFVQHLEFDRNLLRKLRVQIFCNSWTLKEASHESFVFISSTVGI